MSPASIVALVFCLVGLAITVGFWHPRLVDRNRLKELLGRRYPLVFLLYVANGPLLFLLGVILFYRFG